VLSAVRDELVLRGMVLRVLRESRAPLPVALALTGAVGAAAQWGATGCGPWELAGTAGLGVVFAALWTMDRGAWAPVAAHAAHLFTLDTLAHGVLADVRTTWSGLPSGSAWGGADAGLSGGIAAAVAGLAGAAVALWLANKSVKP